MSKIKEHPIVLVADHDDPHRENLKRRLMESGHHVLTATNGDEALQILKTMVVDLVVLRAAMPGLPSVDIVKWIRSRHSALELPVLMATQGGEAASTLAALGAGANAGVNLSLNTGVTLTRIKSLLQMRINESKGGFGSATVPPPDLSYVDPVYVD